MLHWASPASPIDYLELPIPTLKVGALGTHKALGLAKAKGAMFVIASTSEVYGDPLEHPQKETYWGNVNPIGPRGVYDEAKRFAEAITVAYRRYHKLDTKIVRIFNTYGPRMRIRDGRAVPEFISQALVNEDVTVFGDGSQTRSFCYISDLVDGIIRLMLSKENDPINIGNPQEMTIKQIAELIIKMTGSKSQIIYKPLPTDDPKVRQPDITRARTLLGLGTQGSARARSRPHHRILQGKGQRFLVAIYDARSRFEAYQRHQRKRLRRADADPGEGDPGDSRRPRPDRRRADRHRQDRRVRAADARAAGASPSTRHMRALVIAPTRELVAQIEENVRAYGRHLPLRYATIFGGVGEGPQIQALRRGVDIVVATPGRLIDLMEQRHVDFADLQVLVLDEADRMLDMGFLPPIRRIVAATPKTADAALLGDDVEGDRGGREGVPEVAGAGGDRRAGDARGAVTQWVVEVSMAGKVPALMHLLKDAALESVLVFSRTKHGADRIARKLEAAGITTATLHSNRTQGQRLLALKRFKSGEVRVLIATDIAARGIDVDGISHVINFDFPPQPEDYVHRIGRTGRAQAIGDAISFVTHEDEDSLRRLERFLGRGITRKKLEGLAHNAPHHRLCGQRAAPSDSRAPRRPQGAIVRVRRRAVRGVRKAPAARAGSVSAAVRRAAAAEPSRPRSLPASVGLALSALVGVGRNSVDLLGTPRCARREARGSRRS